MSCAAVRIGIAAVVAYSLGALSGSATIAWALAIVAAVAVFAWSRVSTGRNRACGVGGAVPRRPMVARRRHRQRGDELVAHGERRD